MSKQEQQAKGNDRWTLRWQQIRRGVEGNTETQLDNQDLYATHINFVFKGYEVLAVVKAVNSEAEKVVAFHSAGDWEACLYGVVSKLESGDLKWRKDKPWEK